MDGDLRVPSRASQTELHPTFHRQKMWHGNNLPCLIIYESGSYVTFPISGTDISPKSSTFAAFFERKGIKEKFDKRKLKRKPSHA